MAVTYEKTFEIEIINELSASVYNRVLNYVLNHELNKNDSQLLEVNLLNQLKLAKRVNLFDYSLEELQAVHEYWRSMNRYSKQPLDDMLENKIFPTSFEWWGINISFGFMLICLIGIKIFLYRKSNKHKEGKTIQVKSYSNLSLNSAEQIISSIIPWLTIFADKLDFMVLFVCIILQCCFIAIASYNNNNYNLLCSIWGYRYYEVYTEENTYILISGKCIRNKNEIKKFIEVTDYMGLIINEK